MVGDGRRKMCDICNLLDHSSSFGLDLVGCVRTFEPVVGGWIDRRTFFTEGRFDGLTDGRIDGSSFGVPGTVPGTVPYCR
jgi:hypothetical protein